MKYILIHGIGDTQAGWSQGLHVDLGCEPNDIIEVNWEDNVERTWWDKFQRWLFYKTPISKGLLDYGQDVIRYFADKRLRESIVDEVCFQLYMMTEPYYLVGFSLGSVIALEAVAQCDNEELYCAGLITLGSPLGKKVMNSLVKKPKSVIMGWDNYWGNSDPISSRIVVDYAIVRNMGIEVGHNIKGYLAKVRAFQRREIL